VLAVGDDSFQKKCLARLELIKSKKKTTIIFVSHDESALRGFVDRALLFEKGKLLADGSVDSIFEQYHKL
jgi:ABC-type polysaccharide/polyol phosphate transport system ATPase subunit